MYHSCARDVGTIHSENRRQVVRFRPDTSRPFDLSLEWWAEKAPKYLKEGRPWIRLYIKSFRLPSCYRSRITRSQGSQNIHWYVFQGHFRSCKMGYVVHQVGATSRVKLTRQYGGPDLRLSYTSRPMLPKLSTDVMMVDSRDSSGMLLRRLSLANCFLTQFTYWQVPDLHGDILRLISELLKLQQRPPGKSSGNQSVLRLQKAVKNSAIYMTDSRICPSSFLEDAMGAYIY